MLTLKNRTFLLADDHSVVRHGVAIIIRDLINDPIFFHSGNYYETLNIVRNNSIDFLILDISFPDGNDTGIIQKIKDINPEIKILIFSAMEEDVYALRYLNAGVDGFLSKLSNDDEMKEAIESFLLNGKYLSQNVREKIIDNYIQKRPTNPLEILSDREVEIGRLLVKGYGNLEISNEKNLQRTTVSTYKKRIFEKLNIDSLAALIEMFNIYDVKS